MHRRMLSSVGRVATRDSSKDAAGTYDLFVALCEDDAIYPIFKGSRGVFRLFSESRGLTDGYSLRCRRKFFKAHFKAAAQQIFLKV